MNNKDRKNKRDKVLNVPLHIQETRCLFLKEEWGAQNWNDEQMDHTKSQNIARKKRIKCKTQKSKDNRNL